MNNSNSDVHFDMNTFEIIIDILILCVGLPIICLTIYGLYRMVRSDMVVPIYIINLLISDLIQMIARPIFLAVKIKNIYSKGAVMDRDIFELIFFVGLCASVWFMVCISLERYLVVAHPLWYRCRRSVRHATLISAGVWVMTFIFMAISYQEMFSYLPCYACNILRPIVLLLPFPLLIIFFVGTKRAITDTTAVRKAEKRILCTLTFVLSTYTALILPYCIVDINLVSGNTNNNMSIASFITDQLIDLNALMDPVLYILLRPDVRNTLRSLPCCQRSFTQTNCWTSRAEQETEITDTVSPTETSV